MGSCRLVDFCCLLLTPYDLLYDWLYDLLTDVTFALIGRLECHRHRPRGGSQQTAVSAAAATGRGGSLGGQKTQDQKTAQQVGQQQHQQWQQDVGAQATQKQQEREA